MALLIKRKIGRRNRKPKALFCSCTLSCESCEQKLNSLIKLVCGLFLFPCASKFLHNLLLLGHLENFSEVLPLTKGSDAPGTLGPVPTEDKI